MSGFSDYLAQRGIQHFVQGSAQTVPPGTYLALFTAEILDDNTCPGGGEPSGGWYGRNQVPAWAAPAKSSTGTWTANSTEVAFNVCTVATTVTHWALYDALTGGNLLYSGALASQKTLNIDDVFVVKAGDLVIEFR